MAEGGFSIEGEARIEVARWMTVRSALKLEIHGFTRRGRPARILANDITGENHRTREAAYNALNKKIAETLGPDFDKPLQPLQ
jgi:hypothetical protein